MAKVQGKNKAASKKASAKPKARAKSAKPAPKRAVAGRAKKQAKAAAKRPMKAAKAKKAVKKIARKVVAKATPKKLKISKKGAAPAKATKPTTKPAAAPAPVSKTSKVKAAVKVVKNIAKTAVAAAAGAAAVAVVKRVAPPAADEKKRTRRSRPKLSGGGVATATWFSQGERPRPSSFIPAPPRAEAPSLVAAPPASSDRLVSHDELTEFAVRTVPVRVDVEASGGRIFLNILPMDVTLKPGEGIEWDFRYIAGADVVIDELLIEFERPSPFGSVSFRSRRPGSNRPHRQLSGAVNKNAVGKTLRYTVRAFNAFKTEMATAKPGVSVIA